MQLATADYLSQQTRGLTPLLFSSDSVLATGSCRVSRVARLKFSWQLERMASVLEILVEF